MRLAPAFKVKLRTTASGVPSPSGREVVKITVTHASLMAAFSTVNPVKDFVDQLQSMLQRAGGGSNTAAKDAGAAHDVAGKVDHAALTNLEIMGFERARASCALLACDNSSTRSVQWLFDHQQVATSALLQQATVQEAAAPGGTATPAVTGAVAHYVCVCSTEDL